MQCIRNLFKALRAGWKAGTSQYYRTRWHQRRMAELEKRCQLPF